MRISLFGGGTDIDSYAKKYGGFCLNMGINLRQQFILDTDNVRTFDSSLPKGADDSFYETILREMNSTASFETVCDGIITGGLGSSASAAVALLGAIKKARGEKIILDEIAEKAWEIEVNKLKLFGGKQDQYAAAYGGINAIEFGSNVSVVQLGQSFIYPVLNSILLFHTGKNRKSSKIQEGYKDLSDNQVKYLDLIKKYAFQALEIIPKGDIEGLGNLLELTWEAKKKSNNGVSNEEIDQLFDKAKELGAFGGKILGAGGGGYCIFVVHPEKQKKFKEKIGLKWIDYSIDWNGLETRIL